MQYRDPGQSIRQALHCGKVRTGPFGLARRCRLASRFEMQRDRIRIGNSYRRVPQPVFQELEGALRIALPR